MTNSERGRLSYTAILAALLFAANLAAQQGANNSTATTNCASQIAQENKQLSTNMTAIQKQYADAENTYQKAVIDCGGGQGAAACIADARASLTKQQQSIDKQKSDELNRHKKALLDVQNSCTNGTSSSSKQE